MEGKIYLGTQLFLREGICLQTNQQYSQMMIYFSKNNGKEKEMEEAENIKRSWESSLKTSTRII